MWENYKYIFPIFASFHNSQKVGTCDGMSKNQKTRPLKPQQPPNRLARLRMERGLSQTDLGKAVGVGKSTIARWEDGSSGIDILTMRQLADALRIQPSELLEDSDVELRVPSATKQTLRDFGPEEIELVMEAATIVGRLAKRLAPAHNQVSLYGDGATTARMADAWNSLTPQQRERAVDLLDAAKMIASADATRAVAA